MAAITAEQAITVIQGSRGFVTIIAKRLGVSRRHVYNLMEKFTTVAEALEDERESTKDWVEGKLLQRIEKDDTTALIFYAKTQMKDRGYVERQEVRNLNIDVSQLTNEQVTRIAAGEDAAYVLATTSKG